jgi:chromosomal replication initiation ATPase DnaA
MSDQESAAREPGATAPPTNLRNPFIINFCKVLAEKKSSNLEPDAMERLIDEMYRLYENMLGQNMVKALPDGIRQEYLAATKELENLSYEKIGKIFDKHIPDHEAVMKQTLKEFTEIYMRNSSLNPKDYLDAPVPDPDQAEGE